MIHVEHTPIDGKTKITVFERGDARLVAHEVDHLHGILYTDQMREGVTPIPSRRVDLAIAAAYRGLEALWKVLVDAVPTVRFDIAVPSIGGELTRYRLHRRVLEIRDAQQALRAYAPAGERERAFEAARSQRLLDDAADAVAEATELMAALTAHRRGAPVAESARSTAQPPTSPRLLDDALWLLRVAAAMKRFGELVGGAPELGRALVLPSVPDRPSTAS